MSPPKGEWLNLFPFELQIGDIWAERGELHTIIKNQESLTYFMYFSQPGRSLGYTEKEWPEMAPIRIFRPNKREVLLYGNE